MGKREFLWKDVSNEPEIQIRADQAPDLRQALLQLGFQSVGYIKNWPLERLEKKKAWIADKAFKKQMSTIVKGMPWVQEVLMSPDGRALTSIRKNPVGPAVIFRSVSEAGWVVDTSSEVPSGAFYRANPLGLLLRLTGGIKPVQTKAESGYFIQRKAAGASELWELHKRRLQSILDGQAQEIRPHDNPAIYAAGAYHLYRILLSETEATERFLRILGVSWAALVFLVYILVCLGTYACAALGWIGRPDTTVPVILAFFFLIGALILAMNIFYRYIRPTLRGPQPMPLDDLLRDLQSRIGTPEAEGEKS